MIVCVFFEFPVPAGAILQVIQRRPNYSTLSTFRPLCEREPNKDCFQSKHSVVFLLGPRHSIGFSQCEHQATCCSYSQLSSVTLTDWLSLTHSLTHWLTLSHCHSHSLTLIVTDTHSHSLTVTLTLTDTHTLTLTDTHSLIHSRSHYNILYLFVFSDDCLCFLWVPSSCWSHLASHPKEAQLQHPVDL